eukprot:scaffold133306_cov98-Phaeocystis_antarctica.AAC.4
MGEGTGWDRVDRTGVQGGLEALQPLLVSREPRVHRRVVDIVQDLLPRSGGGEAGAQACQGGSKLGAQRAV